MVALASSPLPLPTARHIGGGDRPTHTRQARDPSRLRAAHEHLLQPVERLEAATRAEHDALERRVDEMHRQRRLLRDAPVETTQHRPTADEMDALQDEVL